MEPYEKVKKLLVEGKIVHNGKVYIPYEAVKKALVMISIEINNAIENAEKENLSGLNENISNLKDLIEQNKKP